MIICGQEFAFSALNANDVERMEAAQKHQQAAAEAEQKRYTEECVSYPGILRSQCRMMMSYLDEVLGEGASERLHLDGGDFGAVLKVCESFKQAIAAEKAAINGQLSASLEPPRNRAERRAAAQEVTSGKVVPRPPGRPAHGAARSNCRAGQGGTAAGDGVSLHPGGRKADAQLRGIL